MMVKIENKGKNLLKNQIAGENISHSGEYWMATRQWTGWSNIYIGLGMQGSNIYNINNKDLLPWMNKTLTLDIEDFYVFSPTDGVLNNANILIRYTIDGQNFYYGKDANGDETLFSISSGVPITFNPADYVPEGAYWFIILRRGANDGATFYVKNFQLIQGTDIGEYEPPRSDYIEFNTELFGYNGVYDELRLDGVLVKRWQRESITITSGAGTVTKNGTGTCILVADSDGLPYEGTVSDMDITTSAPDGTYTVIYQLATPESEQLTLTGKGLFLVPGQNNIILPEHAVASFNGITDERIALNSLIGG